MGPWTPTVPNGVADTRVMPTPPPVSASGPFGGTQRYTSFGRDINDAGQIAGTLGDQQAGFLRTPSTPNGSASEFTALKPGGNVGSKVEAYDPQRAGRRHRLRRHRPFVEERRLPVHADHAERDDRHVPPPADGPKRVAPRVQGLNDRQRRHSVPLGPLEPATFAADWSSAWSLVPEPIIIPTAALAFRSRGRHHRCRGV